MLQYRETWGLGGPSQGNQEWLPGGGGVEAGSCKVSMSRNTDGGEAFRMARGLHVHGWSTQPVEAGRQTRSSKATSLPGPERPAEKDQLSQEICILLLSPG